jgi:hypothetical protein
MSVVKKMSGTWALATFVALTSIAAIACEDDGDGDDGTEESATGGGTAGTGGGTGGTCTGNRPDKKVTLIQVLGQDESAFISEPHMFVGLKPDGSAYDPPVTAMSNTSGQATLKGRPCDEQPGWVHVIGKGPASNSMSTYDSLTLSAPDSGDLLIRISTVGTAATAETTGDFKADQSKIAIGGAVYISDPTGKRTGSIGCAQVYMDGDVHPAPGTDQRYVKGVLPATWDKLSETELSGKFYFGNVTKGVHKFKVSLDKGASFVDLRKWDGTLTKELEMNIPFARDDAKGEFKSFLVLVGIDVPGGKTPAGCTQM